jgi:type II secretory ATPase GspE/PulE/Tfp pilus assembly ATPase PilB-like protein
VPDGSSSPSIELFSNSLISAIEREARELLIEIDEKQASLKLRFDSGLTEILATTHRFSHPIIIGRLKKMSELDIVEIHKLQQGRFRLKHKGQVIDVSVSVVPTESGEYAVLRIAKK